MLFLKFFAFFYPRFVTLGQVFDFFVKRSITCPRDLSDSF